MPRAAFTPACAACERIAWKSFVSGRKIAWKTPMNRYKPAVLENSVEITVPQFIKTGDIVRVQVASDKFVDRVRVDAKRV
jgi:Elongation factor P, C-terminal